MFKKLLKFNKYRLMTPGPVPLSPAVLKALALPMIHHRTPAFEKALKNVLVGLKETFQTQQTVFALTSTGSGAMEAAIVNVLSPGDEVLVVVSGKFGERWAKMALAYGLNVKTLNVPWGEAVTLEQVEAQLIQNPRIKALFCQACETSTATTHPIEAIAKLIKKRPETLMIVDAITALGAMPLPMDLWGLDVVVSGSQKAFMLPTGLSFIALSEKAWRFQEKAKCPRFYFDLALEKKSLEKGETFFSSSVSHMRALEVALKNLTGENLRKTILRSEKMARALRAAALRLGLKIYSKSPAASVTALSLPATLDGQKFRKHLEEKYNITVMGGQDQLSGKIIRVGHLGYIENDDLLRTVEAIGLSLKDFGVPLEKHDIAEAVRVCLEKISEEINDSH